MVILLGWEYSMTRTTADKQKVVTGRRVTPTFLNNIMPKDKNWIQKATANNKGALRKELGAKKGQPIPVKKLDAAIKKGGKIAKRAQLAKTLRKLK